MSEELKLNENVSAPQPDALARIARKDDFLQQLQEFLAQHKGENWCVAAIDLEHFKLYTELYGAPQAVPCRPSAGAQQGDRFSGGLLWQ